MGRRFVILDCYVDEPACFGVPPFISPYPRYCYGALVDAGTDPDSIDYITIESLRESSYLIEQPAEMVFLIGGATVPGKYLGHRIGTVSEIVKIIDTNSHLRFGTGGTIGHILDPDRHRNLVTVRGDIEKYAYDIARGTGTPGFRRDYRELARWAPLGAPVCALHPGFPHLICEIETYRGCPRLEHCSFCSEGALNTLEFRRREDILGEIDALIERGISRFRIGRQADILQYGTAFTDFRNGFPRPSPESVKELFSELKYRRDSGRIVTLNVDNANPGTISNFPDESSVIIKSITDAVTPGDTLALGVESLDPVVIRENRLKVDLEELIRVVEMVNAIGGERIDGIPVLLPGVNLIHGLAGESTQTFKINYEGLVKIRDRGLLLKRINIRALSPFPGTSMYNLHREPAKPVRNRYEYYRQKIREEIDTWMLKRIYPVGTMLPDVLIEDHQFEHSLGKQIASYSITARVPMPLPLRSPVDLVVIGHRERSVLALPVPLDLNSLPLKALERIPGIGKKRAADIILQRPFGSDEEISRFLEGVPAELAGVIGWTG